MTFDTPHGSPIDIHAVTTRSTAPAAISSSPSVHMRLRESVRPGAALAEDLAHERHRRAREQAAAGHDVVAVLHAAGGVVEAGELLARRLRLGLEPAPGGDEVVLDRVQVRISQAAW